MQKMHPHKGDGSDKGMQLIRLGVDMGLTKMVSLIDVLACVSIDRLIIDGGSGIIRFERYDVTRMEGWTDGIVKVEECL